ncbi:AbiH family protein [Staphylococcus caprae]|uniref:AbiH family protein n=1 Tax=Staphylococcus caprae TaxID=29380 RepID=UPI003B228CEA
MVKGGANIIKKIMFVENFSNLFREWVHNLQYTEITKVSAKKYLNNLFNKNINMFFTFNYTLTLENIYNINEDNIKYIHVVKNGEGYEFGHDKVEKIDTIGHVNFGVRKFLRQQLYKDTSKIYENNRDWFEELSEKKSKIFIFMVLVLQILI